MINFSVRFTRSSHIILTLIFLVTAIGCTPTKPEARVANFNNKGYITRLDGSLINSDSLTVRIENLMKKTNVKGMALSILNNNEPVYQHYFGLSNGAKKDKFKPETVFYGASFSKAIFAYTVMKLVENNVLHLDTPLYKYLKKPLPEYRSNVIGNLLGSKYFDYHHLYQQNEERYKLITARMCLYHTTGFQTGGIRSR